MKSKLPWYDLDALERVFAMDEITAAVRGALIAHAEGRVLCPPPGQLLFEQPRGDCHIKYGTEEGGETFVVKVATGFYDNPGLGLPVNDGITLLFSARTGQPLAMFQDQGWLTGWRTAAAGALAVVAGAPARVRRLGIVGTGHQAELQARWAAQALGDVPVVVWGRSMERAAALATRLADQGVACTTASDVGALLQQCNAVVACTSASSPVIPARLVRPGTHLVSIGADSPGKSELDPALFGRAAAIALDDRALCLEHGDSGRAVRAGYVADGSDIALGDVLAGDRVLRSSEDDITLVTLTGIAAQDLAIARWAHAKLAGDASLLRGGRDQEADRAECESRQ